MTTKELMVGDWVLMDMNYSEEDPMYTKTDYKPYKIKNGDDIDLACETNCIGDADVYQPIPLTTEILEKNGFTKSERYEVWKTISDDYELRITPWRVAVIFLDEDGADKEEFSLPRPKYVNELQRALRCVGLYEFANNIKI